MKAYGADGFVQMPENITYGDGQYFQKCFYDDKYEDWDTAKCSGTYITRQVVRVKVAPARSSHQTVKRFGHMPEW